MHRIRRLFALTNEIVVRHIPHIMTTRRDAPRRVGGDAPAFRTCEVGGIIETEQSLCALMKILGMGRGSPWMGLADRFGHSGTSMGLQAIDAR